ncbi:MAG: hypothetical protein NTY36_16510, partial [Deltaproteobacteria bacterium]|nr:hypothetical protein [Deltaproteobacteria bacterium]
LQSHQAVLRGHALHGGRGLFLFNFIRTAIGAAPEYFPKLASCKNLHACHSEGAKRPKNLVFWWHSLSRLCEIRHRLESLCQQTLRSSASLRMTKRFLQELQIAIS